MIMSKSINSEYMFMRVYARQHGGGDALSNLALCCVHCNIIRRLERLGLAARDRERQDFSATDATRMEHG